MIARRGDNWNGYMAEPVASLQEFATPASLREIAGEGDAIRLQRFHRGERRFETAGIGITEMDVGDVHDAK